jgi:hypothetical protein
MQNPGVMWLGAGQEHDSGGSKEWLFVEKKRNS